MGNRVRVTAGNAWTAVAAGCRWLLSGALFAILSWFSIVPTSLARLVVPETVAASAWLVAPFSGADRSSLAMGLDMVNGGYAAVTAWSLPKSAG
jgi:hypothetical protein